MLRNLNNESRFVVNKYLRASNLIFGLGERTLICSLSINVFRIFVLRKGALTNKVHPFQARPWELTAIDAIDIFDAQGCYIQLETRGITGFLRTLPNSSKLFKLNFISDKVRFALDGIHEHRLISSYVNDTITSKIVKKETEILIYPITADDAKKICSWHIIRDLLKLKLIYLRISNKLRTNRVIHLLPSNISDSQTSLMFINFLRFTNNFHVINLSNRGTGQILDSNFDLKFNTCIQSMCTTADWFFLICTNLRVEIPILAMRLRATLMGKLVITFGPKTEDTFDNISFGISLKKLYNMFRGKHILTQSLINSNQPIIIVGASFLQTIQLNLLSFAELLTQFRKSLGISQETLNFTNLTISHNGNLDVGAYTPNYLTTDITIEPTVQPQIVYNLNNFDIKSIIYFYDFLVGHLSQNYNNLTFFDLVFPVLMPYEQTGIYINLEGIVRRSNRAIIQVPAYKTSRIDESVFHNVHLFRILNEYLSGKFINQNYQQLFNKCLKHLYNLIIISYLFNSLYSLNNNCITKFKLITKLSYYIQLQQNINIKDLWSFHQMVYLIKKKQIQRGKLRNWILPNVNKISLYINNYWTNDQIMSYSSILAYKNDRLEKLNQYPFINF